MTHLLRAAPALRGDRARRLAGLLAGLLALPTLAHAQASTGAAAASTAATAAASWYDATPLLVSLRPAGRAGAAQAAGVAHAEDLPLYDLSVDLDLAAGAVAVREEVWFTNRESAPLDELVLRIYANTTTPGTASAAHSRRPAVRFDGGRCLDGAACTVTAPSADVLVVRPATPLAPGARLRLGVDLGATLERIAPSRTNLMSQGLEGLASMQSGESAGDYGLVALGDGIASLANFYAVLARRENGRWIRSDESTLGDLGGDDLAHFRAHVRVGAGVQVASTGVTLPTPRAPHGAAPAARHGAAPAAPLGATPRLEIVAAVARDFALLASRDFVVAARDVGGVTVRSWFRASERAAGHHVLDVAASALALYAQRFGAYPYAELDVVEAALVGGAGGVEFAGLVTVASMFYKAPSAGGGGLDLLGGLLGGAGSAGGTGGAGGTSTMEATVARMREFVTAHEVAHQFWHGLVGSDSRAHPFVDEGLAQWSAMLYLEDRYGLARATQDGDLQVRMNYQMMRLQNVADAPVDRPVRDFPSSIAYAGLVYGKGPYVYAALRREVGDATFFAALAEYVRTYRFRMAPQRGFIDLLARGPHAAAVRALAQRWLDERHGDEDLGRGDPRTLAATMMGVDPSALPPELGQLLGGLGSGALGGDLGGALGGALGDSASGSRGLQHDLPTRTDGAGDDDSPEVGMQGVEQLIRLLGGANP